MNRIDEYILSFPENVAEILHKLRTIIKVTVPASEEDFAYKMPAFKLMGRPLAYFAAFQKHIGFYATPLSHSEFDNELSVYKRGKGSVQFPLDKDIPFDLIARMVRFKALEIQGRGSKVKSRKIPSGNQIPRKEAKTKRMNR